MSADVGSARYVCYVSRSTYSGKQLGFIIVTPPHLKKTKICIFRETIVHYLLLEIWLTSSFAPLWSGQAMWPTHSRKYSKDTQTERQGEEGEELFGGNSSNGKVLKIQLEWSCKLDNFHILNLYWNSKILLWCWEPFFRSGVLKVLQIVPPDSVSRPPHLIALISFWDPVAGPLNYSMVLTKKPQIF